MQFSFLVAKRYLFSKKRVNVINIISLIAIVGVSFGTMAFIIVLSVFNGLEAFVSSQFNTFDPDLRIELVKGKTFPRDSAVFDDLKNIENIAYASFIIEENALLEYDGKQVLATIKAVDENYKNVTGVDTMVYDGDFILVENPQRYAVVGHGIAARLGIGLQLIYPLRIWAPKRTEGINLSFETAFNSKIIGISGIFAVQPEYDNKYVIVPIEFANELMNYNGRSNAIEIKLANNADIETTQEKIKDVLGTGFFVKNRHEQKQLAYKIMRSEKLAIIAILSFILLVSSFNIIGTMVMLIIEKREDISTLHALGADVEKIRRIFVIEGWMISTIGAIAGLIIGLLLCFGQQTFGWIEFPAQGIFINNSYPVNVHFQDVALVLLVVITIGYIVAKYPVKYITRKFFATK